jgi:hypothetical protein
LRKLLRHQPFEPFDVELVDGKVITVKSPKVVFGGGGASFFTPEYELIEFECEEVRGFRPTSREVAS